MTIKRLLKSVARALFLLWALPLAAFSGFGRIRSVFAFFAQFCSQVPGLPGDYCRVAYYRMTLEKCSPDSCISFGTFFAHPEATVAAHVYIGSYCVIGRARIGERTQIASGVQILSGSHQHARAADGRITGSDKGEFSAVHIGADCWIGAAAVVMADVGAGSTIGAGAVVARAIPAGSTAVGVPARVME
jgi:virginiamycin A acetyltransferase